MLYHPETNVKFMLHSDVRRAFPWILFGETISDDDLAVHGVFPLAYDPPPVDATHVADPVAVELIDGTWTQLWSVRAAEPHELPPAVSEAQIVAAYMAVVQRHMDAHAVTFGYDNLVSVISYAEEPSVPRYQDEGKAFRAWRSLCWLRCEEVLGEVRAGERPAPTDDELISLLPEAPIKL